MKSTCELQYEYSSRIYIRSLLFLGLVLVLFAGLIWRLYQIQYVHYEELSDSVQGYIQSNISWTPRRGRIFDARGRDLAISIKTPSCAFDPKIAEMHGMDRMEVIASVGKALNLTPAELDKVYSGAMKKNSRFVWIKRRLLPDELEAVKELKLPGLIYPVEYTRKYPQGVTASQVLGFSNIDGTGMEGIEKTCDSILRGLEGTRNIQRDAVGRKLAGNSSALVSKEPGLDVELTIDSYVQDITERELEKAVTDNNALSGCAVVMDPATGDILAMAGYPSFDANSPADFPAGNRLNPIIASVFEPGSIFKSIVMSAALEQKVVTPTTEFNCEGGAWRMPENGRVLHDSHGYGVLPVATILTKSSNIGMAKIAAIMGKENLYRGLKSFGIGDKTGVPIAGELSGTLRHFGKWTSYSMGSLPMGQEVTITPLQAVTAYSAIANGGVLLKPRLVKNIYSEDKLEKTVPVTPVRKVISSKVSEDILKMLKDTVETGTGKRARSKMYTVGGKTGTAQLACNAEEIAAGHKGYSPNRYIGSFIAVSPIESPRVIVLVSIREPKKSHYGGTVAAPAVKNIIDGVLNYYKVPMSPGKKEDK